MITAIVQFSLRQPISLEEAARVFESTAPKYKGLRGLVRKYYLRSEDGRRAGGVYLWETRSAAEAVYTGEWKARVKQLYGSEPEISWFDTPVVVDNEAGGTVAEAPGVHRGLGYAFG
jgi:putative monooxygenase ydhR